MKTPVIIFKKFDLMSSSEPRKKQSLRAFEGCAQPPDKLNLRLQHWWRAEFRHVEGPACSIGWTTLIITKKMRKQISNTALQPELSVTFLIFVEVTPSK